MLSLDGIARALGGEVSGNMVRAPGPDHSTVDRSLGIWITANGDDIRVDSKAGDDPIRCKDYVRERIGLPGWEPGADRADGRGGRTSTRGRNHWPVDAKAEPAATANDDIVESAVMPIPVGKQPGHFHSPKLGAPATVYTYRDADGCDLGYIARFETAQGKVFLPTTLWQSKAGLAWRHKSWPKPRPLYGLDRLAAQPYASVIVCEGEKSANAAQLVFPNSVVITSPADRRRRSLLIGHRSPAVR